MFKDKKAVWVLEYVFGGVLIVVPMAELFFCRQKLIDAYILVIQLFVISLGVILISCASAMRQRVQLAKRIDSIEEQIQDGSRIAHESEQTESQKDENR